MFDEKKILKAKYFNGREHYLQYENDYITFTQILVIPNLTCSLRCKYCAAGNQYADRKEFDAECTVDDLDKLMSVCRTRQINIQGGEIFLNKQLEKFFESFSKMKNLKNVESAAIFTNATVVPTDAQLDAYEKINIPKKIIISNYKLPQVKTEAFVQKISERGLNFFITPEDHYWFHPGSPLKETGYSENELKELLHRCTKFCRAPKLIDGRFFACGQNGYAIYKNLKDCLDIRKIHSDALKHELYDYVYNRECYDICKYCRGEFEGCELIPAAEQLVN